MTDMIEKKECGFCSSYHETKICPTWLSEEYYEAVSHKDDGFLHLAELFDRELASKDREFEELKAELEISKACDVRYYENCGNCDKLKSSIRAVIKEMEDEAKVFSMPTSEQVGHWVINLKKISGDKA